MTTESDLPPRLVAALTAPKGTTVDDFTDQFPDQKADSAPTITEDPELAGQLRQALDDWHRRHGWGTTMPTDTKNRIAQQVRDELTWGVG